MRRRGTAARHSRAGHLGVCLAGLLALTLVPAVVAAADAETTAEAPLPDLTLVTLTGPGTSPSAHRAGTPAQRAALLARQDRLLASVGAGEPTYRWTTALNGFAVPLSAHQAEALREHPDVALVEPNAVRRLAGRVRVVDLRLAGTARTRGGAGVVVGVVDTGIAPDAPSFAEVPGLGRDPDDFTGACSAGEDWPVTTCNRKLVGAGWWVAGFGADRLRSTESLSARDTTGHGSQVASVAAGNPGVSVRIGDRNVGDTGGVAPSARVAAYKACWAAPDPDDDGCSVVDLVSAIDRATADGVDVLDLAVAGPDRVDTVERALLGAAEADVVVVAAAGNNAARSYASHSTPWVTSVGAVTSAPPRSAVVVPGGPRFEGAGRSHPSAATARLVRAADVAAPGVDRQDARQCRPGALDAGEASGRVVVCHRGGIGRVDKSAAVAQADGVGMVLVNDEPGSTHADFHSVPTVHLSVTEGRRLLRWLRHHPATAVRLTDARPEDGGSLARQVAAFSAAGDPRGVVVKPDVVAPGVGVLGVVPASSGASWSLFSGTSAATARVAGQAALLRARHGWSAPLVRSALSTSAKPVPGTDVLSQGAGVVRGTLPQVRLGLDVPSSAYRRALRTDRWHRLNTPSVLLGGGRRATTRTLTNLGTRAEYFSVSTRGFRRPVRVTPLAVRLRPGETATFRMVATGAGTASPLDDGSVVWRGARGSVTRIPVVVSR